MVIAIQKGLENIGKELEARGYEVFSIGESGIADAVLYKDIGTYPYYDVNNISSAASSLINENMYYGALLVNITNKSMDDIVQILENRVYSPLI